MNKDFEKLIEYVINDEDDKARELFHDIVVNKSRQIYEEMMEAEEIDEADDEEIEEGAEEIEEGAEEEEEEIEESFGGDAADDLIDDVEAEEEGMAMEDDDEFAGDDMGGDMGDGDVEGKLMDIEDKLDELMAEFEALMGDGDMGGDDMDMDMDDMGDDLAGDDMDMDVDMDATDDMGDEEELDIDIGADDEMMEAISLKAAPKPVTSEEGSTNKKSPTAFNSGSAGMQGKPVHTGASMGGKHDTPAYKNSTQDLIKGEVQNAPAKSTVKMSPATKPHLAQATGVNTRSPLAKG